MINSLGDRKKDIHFHKCEYVENNNSHVEFTNLYDGYYDVRYFKQDYEKVCEEKGIFVGNTVDMNCYVSENNNIIHIDFPNVQQLSEGDFVCLFERREVRL